MSLLQALADATAEIGQGASVSVLEEIAADYGINPKLLTRKFEEQNGPAETYAQRLKDAADYRKVMDEAIAARKAAKTVEDNRKWAAVLRELQTYGLKGAIARQQAGIPLDMRNL